MSAHAACKGGASSAASCPRAARHLVACVVLCGCSAWGGVARAELGYWTQQSGRSLPEGRAEMMALGPSRYGVRDGLEVGSSLVVFAAMPNAQLKWALFDQPSPSLPWSVAMRHRVTWPGMVYQIALEELGDGASPYGALTVFDTDVLMTKRVDDGLWRVHVGGVASWRRAREDLAQGANNGEGVSLLLWHRAPVSVSKALVWGVRGGAARRHYIGREGVFVEGAGALHIVPSSRHTGLELDARCGIERRHMFAEFGARSVLDGGRLETLPVFEVGVGF